MPYVTAADGVRTYYETAGEGRPLLLITGAFGTMESWGENGWIDALARERRLIMIDLRGHGRSDKPHDPSLYGWRQNATDALAVLEEEDARGADVFGQSMGGQVVIALLHADTSRIRSLAANGAYPTPDIGRPIGRMLKRAKMLRERGMPWVLGPGGDELTHLPGEENSDAYRARVLAGDAEAFACEAEGQAMMLDQYPPQSGPPALFVATEHDPLAVQTCRELPAQFPYIRYVEVPGESHFIARQPQKFVPILREFWGNPAGVAPPSSD
jgi:pimeloyl-ACP methyl ester carboxylesterase